MRVAVALPHRDLSLAPSPVDGFEVFDAARAFVDRVLAPGALLERAEQLELPGSRALPQAALMLRAAADLLGRVQAPPTSRLRGSASTKGTGSAEAGQVPAGTFGWNACTGAAGDTITMGSGRAVGHIAD